MSEICVDSNGDICIDASGDICTGASVDPVDCNECDPPMPSRYTVVLSGLGGDLAGANGSWNLLWDYECTWVDDDPGSSYVVSIQYDGDGNWAVLVYTDPTGCVVILGQDVGNTCDATGTYSLDLCEDSLCIDTDTCTDSSGAVATVDEAD